MISKVLRFAADTQVTRAQRAVARRRWVAAGAIGSVALVSVIVACGPSAQSIYEGDVRFEHCYRLDLDLNIAATHREACWKQWLTLYTYGQSRDRIEYARRRVRAFATGDLSRPALDTSVERREASRPFYLVVPEPTTAHAPPPPIAAPMPPADAGAPPPPPPAAPPASHCASDCESSWKSCKAACGPDGGASEAACKSCEPDYKRCMRRCFR